MLMVPESACIPVPSEVTLLFAGVAVYQGWLSFPLAVLAAAAGNLLGSLLAYALGASGLLARVPGARVVLHRWEGQFERYGTRAVLSRGCCRSRARSCHCPPGRGACPWRRSWC
jgi:membrane protein DedA with SNARE-associated domain